MTVVVRAVAAEPTIEFGFSATSGNEPHEFKEIRRIMRAHGLRTELLS